MEWESGDGIGKYFSFTECEMPVLCSVLVPLSVLVLVFMVCAV